MADDQSKQNNNVQSNLPERPLDPTQNAGDMFNDTSGMTGVTQGAPQQSSAEPSDTIKDETEIKGGVIQNPTHKEPTGFPKSAVSDEEYTQKVSTGMSSKEAKRANDTAEEPAQSSPTASTPQPLPQKTQDGVPDDFGDQTNTKFTTTQDAPYQQVYNQGEQDAVGGTTPDPRTDDDTLDMAQRAGFQTEETTEHPQPVDAGRDIDKAEKEIS